MAGKRLLALIGCALILTGCENLIVSPAGSDLNLEDFEAAWERVNNVYPYLEHKRIDWDSIYTVYRPRAEQAWGDEIYTVLIEMLGELKDIHVVVRTGKGSSINTYYPPRWIKDKYSYNPAVVRNYFDTELKMTGEGRIEYGILPGNIGYIYLATFDDDYMTKYFITAFNYIQDTKALILDIRHNNGGSFQNVEAVVRKFITAPLERPEYYVLGELIPLSPYEPLGSNQYINPVIVLINGVCVSAGDLFPEIMKQIPNVTVVGDTTSGGSSGSTTPAPALYTLPSGKIIFVGTTDLRRYDGLPWEWIGVPPDILVQQTREDIDKGVDKQLEFAIDMLK